MAITQTMYPQSILNAYKAAITDISAVGTAVKVSLHTLYTYDQTDDTWADVSATEVAAAGNYVAGGNALSNKTLTRVDDTVTFDSTDCTFTNVTIASYNAAIVRENATGKLLSCIAFGEELSITAKDLVLVFSASGIFYGAT